MKFSFLNRTLFAGLFIVLISCKKVGDTAKPEIDVISVSPGDSIPTGDVFYLKGKVKDNDAVHEISYEIRGISSDSVFLLNSFHVHMTESVFADSLVMPSEDLNISVRAEDHSENEAKAEFKIYHK